MSLTRQKKGPENIPAKTAMHVSYVTMTAAGYASAKNPAFVKNQLLSVRCIFEIASNKGCNHAFALDRRAQIVYRIFTINLSAEPMK
jgi:hypothetical protein